MKNFIFVGAMLASALWLTTPAMATLIGDEITGGATGLTNFGPGTATVVDDFDPEFFGTLDLHGNGSVVFDIRFMFFSDLLSINIEHNLSGATEYMTDFTVTFSDLDYVGFPTYILKDVASIYDNRGNGEGLSVMFTDDAMELTFTNFMIPESRELELGLVFEEEIPVTPVPEPATAVLVGIGATCLALRRRFC